MALPNLNVWIHLDNIHCFDEADGWGSAEPYLWAVFFKIDGETCHVDSSLQLQGTSQVWTGPGSHGNLNNSDVDGGDDVAIPAAIGSFSTALRPIPVDISGIDPVSGTVGAAIILMEEDNVSDGAAENGHIALRDALKSQLDALITTLNIGHPKPTQQEIDAIKKAVKDAATKAIKDSLGFWASIWAWLNEDDEIGDMLEMHDSEELSTKSHIDISQRWTGDNGDWQLTGGIEAGPICTIDLFSILFGSEARSMEKAMRQFHDEQLHAHRGLLPWWDIVSQATPQTSYLLARDPEFKKAATALMHAAPELLASHDKTIPPQVLEEARTVFSKLAALPDRRTRIGANRVLTMLPHLEGQSTGATFKRLTEVRPARYPRTPEGKRLPRRVEATHR